MADATPLSASDANRLAVRTLARGAFAPACLHPDGAVAAFERHVIPAAPDTIPDPDRGRRVCRLLARPLRCFEHLLHLAGLFLKNTLAHTSSSSSHAAS